VSGGGRSVVRQGATVRRVRPAVDVVVPFRGSAPGLADLVERLHGLVLEPGDTVTVVDNTPAGVARASASQKVRIVAAPERQSSYHARNRGAAAGVAPWLLFLDADVEPAPRLADRYLTEAPGARTGVLVGTVRDVGTPSGHESLAGRYARVRRLIDQANTLQMTRPYAKTANCLVRRAAFEHVGGFVDDIRSGGDADLCFRLREAGWELEPRPDAVAEHRSRQRLLGLLGQRARHGSGAEWLELRYPGFVGPRRRLVGLARNLVEGAGASAAALVRGDGEQALVHLMDPVSNAAFDLGRRIPNETWREQPLLRRVRGRPA
jgi:cellulose synthase/poly-beta-1,6-N-acetylglucosamine synthase-like glycosyltransferase